MQRERTRNLTLKEIENYFHLPIQEAANKMEFSATVVKKICRKYGVTRWPHRKVCFSIDRYGFLGFFSSIYTYIFFSLLLKSLHVLPIQIQSMEKKITNWASRLTSINDPEERARAENVIQSLQREISRFGEGSS